MPYNTIRWSAVRGNDLPIYRLLCLGNIDKAESHFVSQSDSGGNPFQDLAIVRIERTHAYTFYVQGKILRFRRLVALAVERRSQDVVIFDATCRLELTVQSNFER